MEEKHIQTAGEETEKTLQAAEGEAAAVTGTEKPGKTGSGKKKKRRRIRRLVWSLILVAALGLIGWSVYSRLQAEYRITYDPYTATSGNIANSLSFTGSMQLINSASYTADGDAKVREVYVAAGDRVQEGDRLLRLSNGTQVTADFEGTVSSLNVAPGDDVAKGAALATLADFDHMKVSVRVGESSIAQVSVGQACRVTVSSAGAVFDSVIDAIDYAAYTGNNVAYYTATVKVDTSEADNLWPGMQATVTVTLEEAKDVTVLRMDALSTARDNTAFVYKETESGEMEQVPVTVGVSNGNYVEIKDGVKAGETVYKVAVKSEELTGLSALFSGMFTNTQVNRNSNQWNRQNRNSNQDMGGMPGGDMPGGNAPGGNGPGNSNTTQRTPGGGSRGN